MAARLDDLPHAFLKAGALVHPAPPPYRLILDRVSFCDPFLRQLMRYWSMAGAYVLNDPFFTLVYDKYSECLVYDALGIRHPRTILLPGRNGSEDVSEIASAPDWDRVEAAAGFPCILKPVDGYAWQDVFRVPDRATLQGLYETLTGKRNLVVQELVSWTAYYRAFCVGAREVLIVRWLPRPFDLGAYSMPAPGELGARAEELICRQTIELNAAFRLDFNSVEWCLTTDGTPMVIDSLNDVPDVRKERLPAQAWGWVVDRLAACARERLASGARNRTLSDPGPPAG